MLQCEIHQLRIQTMIEISKNIVSPSVTFFEEGIHVKRARSVLYVSWQVSLDIMGPLRESQGNKYFLLVVDQFSKWYKAVALPNQEAKIVSRVFVEHWMVRFGCPVNLHSDQGSKFVSKLFCSLCSELRI